MTSIELSSGIIIDTERNQAYVMAPEGGVTAIALSDGQPLWHSGDAERPLLLSDNLLIGQSGSSEGAPGVTIRMLRVEEAGVAASESVVPLPGAVDPLIEPTANRGFNLSAEPLDGDAVLRWEFRERPMRGLDLRPQEVLPGEALPGTEAALDAPGLPPPGAEGVATAGEDETIIRGQVRISPLDGSVQPMVEATTEMTLPGVPQFPTKRADVAPPALESTLAVEDPLVFRSADGKHLLRSAPLDSDDLWTNYRWQVFESGGTEPILTVTLHVSFAPFVVVGDRLIVELQPYSHRDGVELIEEPMQLRAYALSSGDQAWFVPTRDVYAVPAPPH